jgi:GNAT superfamily N-acetyltransferase
MRYLDVDDALIRKVVELEAARVAYDAARSLRTPTSSLEVRRFGDAIALRDRQRADAGFVNRVIGLGPKDREHVDAIVDFYESAGIPCQLDLTPNHFEPAFLGDLRDRGFGHTGSLSWLQVVPEATSASAPGIVVERVDAPRFAPALSVIFEDPSKIDPEVRRTKERFYVDNDDYELYLASIDGAPAAVMSLFFHDGVAHFANATTKPALRRRGCQSALIAHGIDRATTRGCSLAVADLFFGTSSHRNVERLGFRGLYQTAWLARPAPNR